jgi:hypothetical protein
MLRTVTAAVLLACFGCANLTRGPKLAPGTPAALVPVPEPTSSAPLTCDPAFYEGLPDWAERLYFDRRVPVSVARHRELVPEVLQGDFDGDGALDVAIPVRTCEEGAVGVAVLLQEPGEPLLFGAGEDGADLSWLEYWFVTHDPNAPDLLDLGERCTIGASAPGASLELDCSS